MRDVIIGSALLAGLSGHEAGRQLLEQLYRQHYAMDMPPITVTERGKPCFTTGNVHFSISHTEDAAFCVLSDRPVGIDAESMDRKVDLRLADKILSPTEKVRYEKAADKNAALLQLWVQKEAYAKLTGRGWGSYLYETDFDPAETKQMNGCYVAVLEEKDNVI